jgi:hypothetical protein
MANLARRFPPPWSNRRIRLLLSQRRAKAQLHFTASRFQARRMPTYLKVWALMEKMQHDFAHKPPVQGSFERSNGKLVMG